MNLMSIYSTPLWQSEFSEFEELKEDFILAAKEFRTDNPSLSNPKSNVFGYQSPSTLQQLNVFSPLYEYACQMAFKACADLDFGDVDIAITGAWLNVNDSRQCMNHDHIHGDVFTGVFYISAPEGSGKLVIKNPGINKLWKGCDLATQKNQFTGEIIRIDPVEGSIILFPSYISHAVETNDHDEERISIGFNIIALPKGTLQNRDESDLRGLGND